jgi:hypothetical protein
MGARRATKKNVECPVCSRAEESRLLMVRNTSRKLVNAVLWERGPFSKLHVVLVEN